MYYNINMNINKWIEKNCSDLSNKTIAITGSTGGLGRCVCRYLVKSNANLILIDRDTDKAKAQANELISINPNINIDIITCELTDFSSVKLAIEKLNEIQFNVLILNAGAYNIPINKTNLGYNNVFQINFLSQYYMVKKLLPKLRKQSDAKVIALGSIAHDYSKINENDIDFSLEKRASKIYGNSKRFLMFSLYELFKNEDKVKLSIVHPGVTLTNMTNRYPKAINWLVKFGIKILFPSVNKASLNILYSIYHSCGYHEWIGPKIFDIWGQPTIKKLKTCSSLESKKIFDVSENLYNLINKSSSNC